MAAHREALFGLGIESGVDQVDEMLAHARVADEAGLDFFSLGDHPYFADRVDAYAALSYVLGATERLAGAVICTNLLNRHAPVLARTATSLAEISGGRAILPLGATGMPQDIEALGAPSLSPGERVVALEEAIQIVRALSGGGAPVSFEGEHYRVSELPPARTPAPPIWVGVGGPKGLAVAGRHADGWIPPHVADWRSRTVAERRPLVDEAAVAAGRDPAEIATIYLVAGPITAEPWVTTRDEEADRWSGGGVDQWVEELTTAVLEYGAGGFNYLAPPGVAIDDATVNRWVNEVVPAVREAIAVA